MKKNYIYFVAPLAGLVVFSAVYWNYSATYDARLAAVKKAEHDKAQEKLDREAAERMKAATEAKKSQDERKAQKLAADLKKAQDEERHDRAVQAQRKARNDADKLKTQVARLTKEVEDTKKEIAALEEDKKRSLAEEAFVEDYVKKSQENVRGLLANLDKIAEADKKWEEAAREAARLAAAAAKK